MGPTFERGRETHQCAVKTAEGHPCKVPADRFYHGEWLCHLHDPKGNHQRAQANKYHRPIPQPSLMDLVSPLIADHTEPLFAAPTPEQMKVVKKRQSAWRRQTAQPHLSAVKWDIPCLVPTDL